MGFDRSILEDYDHGGHLLRESVAGLTPADCLAHPIPGTWSIHEIVIHLQDSDLIGIHRMQRIAAENNPLLIGFDESAFMRHLRPELQSMEDALTLFEVGRRQFARVLRALPDEYFQRQGVHNDVGKVSLGELVVKYQNHLLHHLKFVKEKRRLLGKPSAA